MGTIWKVLTRKKIIDPVTAEDSQLARRLNTFDLTALGVGSTLGVGVYVLAGHVAKTVAGPSVVLSFLIAAVASVFAGLCYAEFGARAPRAGSAYIYSYVCVGEFIAFIIGWNLILEYVIGSASVAKGLSLYLDNLLNNTLQNTFTEIAPINLPFMAKYFDFFSCGISILLAVALAFGLKESSWANNIFTTLNIGVVLFVIVAGSLKADTANWHLAGNSTNSTIGNGGFFPFGIEGTIKGAATCFYGFVGFDCIATTGEEAKNPKKAIPLSIVLSLLIIFLAYFGISTVVTLMVPYYLQNPDAPIPYAFEHIGWNWAKWIVSIGGIFGLCASLFGAMFPLPRIIYAMATDSLVFKFLGKVHNRFQTPVIGTLIAGTLTGLMAALFELNQLVNMMSIGTLMAYTIVAASVLLLRYSDNISTFNVNTNVDEDNSLLDQNSYGEGSAVGQIFNCGRYAEPTKISQRLVAVEVFLYCLTCVLIGLSAIYLKHPILNGDIWAIVLTSVVIFIAALLLMSIATQPVSRKELSFKVPMVPLIPALSILANIYLMLMLDFHTWIRFAVWMAVGLPIYYFSVRMIDNEPEIKKAVVENKLNGNLNYYVNNGYVDDLSLNKEMKTKKKPAPQPPKSPQKSIDKMEVNEIMEQFDEILEEAANTLERNNRKRSSAGSISLSDVASHEENVVADVHCDVAIPATPVFPSENPIENVEVQNKENQSVSTEDNSIKENEIIVSNEDINISEPKVEKIKPTLPPLTLTNGSDSSSQTNLTVPLDRPVSFISTTSSSPEYVETIPNVTSAVTSVTNIPLPPPLPLIELAETKTIPIEQTLNTPSFQRKNTRETLRRVSSDTLKEVTLRPTRKRVENNKEEYKPDDDNLKVNSDKAKSFIENLSTKLYRPNMIPSYIVPTKGIAPRPPSKYEKNENVIEENINKDEAKEKLGLFVNSRVSIIEPNKVKETPTPIQDNTINQEKNEESEDSAYLAHKNRMKNVFRSMKIPDASKEPIHTQRNSVTLEHKIDENKQRQAMKQIFESIQLRRKESTQQFSDS